MESKIRHLYDASLALVAPGSAAVTATTATSGVSLYKITNSPYGALNGRFGLGAFDIAMYISAMATTTTSDTYTIQVQTTDDAGANIVTHDTITVTAAMVGQPLAFGYHPVTLGEQNPAATQIRLNIVEAGPSSSITFWAYVAPLVRQM